MIGRHIDDETLLRKDMTIHARTGLVPPNEKQAQVAGITTATELERIGDGRPKTPSISRNLEIETRAYSTRHRRSRSKNTGRVQRRKRSLQLQWQSNTTSQSRASTLNDLHIHYPPEPASARPCQDHTIYLANLENHPQINQSLAQAHLAACVTKVKQASLD